MESVNLGVLAELKELLAEGFEVLVERFILDGQARIDKMQESLSAGSAEVLYAEAHGLKGSSRNVGANLLADYCGQLEAMGHAQNLAGAEPIFSAVVKEFSAVCQALQDFSAA